MDLARFGEEHHDYFDPNVYLNSYFKVEGRIEVYNDFALRCFHEFWSKVNNKNQRVLEFGGGPVICNLIPATPYAQEIVFTEYTEKNRREVQKWLQESPDAHDWSAYFKFFVETLEGRKGEDITVRESELRKKISHVLPCDIERQDPVLWPPSYEVPSFDVVTSSLCLEACVTSREGYRDTIAKLKSYLKPGGFIVLYGVLGESFYMVGQEKFHCFPLTKQLVEETLISEGFKILDDMKISLFKHEYESICDAKGLFFVSAILLS
ncbi:indolethylamine N-methyltransferase-like [Montipora capricornis]|uniref:indolethylamine N-methyltransferase-like n=1 Tax=Montipora capricornis TaxID=246305 RepID=UPI0035F1B4F9